MRDLYDLTVTQALEMAVKRVKENNPTLSKAFCKKVVLNTLIYDCVIDEIAGQAEFLLGRHSQPEIFRERRMLGMLTPIPPRLEKEESDE